MQHMRVSGKTVKDMVLESNSEENGFIRESGLKALKAGMVSEQVYYQRHDMKVPGLMVSKMVMVLKHMLMAAHIKVISYFHLEFRLYNSGIN